MKPVTTCDQRPELSAKLHRLSEGTQWFTWRGRRLQLQPVPTDEPFYPQGHLAIVVHRGRFGLGLVVDCRGLRATDVEWLNDGRTTAQVYLRPRDVRALVAGAEGEFGDARAEVALLRARVREAEAAMAEETRRAEEMQHQRDENAAQWMAWRAEAMHLRTRVKVNKQDAAERGIQPAQAVAWASAHGWLLRLSTPTVTIVSNSIIQVRIPLLADAVDYHASLAFAVREIAEADGRAGLDVLDEMAAMPVEVPKP